ncbi:PLAC8-domain-containing protein [Sistotremastrum suecicum HHB10207 ss-3]|uniref:PLAC8-domain-containing protein n=1 Tax=Sistotremastrum suecicum HHB10207 ss-3 TaxID=1314776 RepID=A0A166GFE3_9AGAM|nr:PLAC8-domain-containing protein [Sistotremastrum suecicum HHB10207 ss-3]
MTVDHKNVKGLAFNKDNQRSWSNGIFGCFGDCATCCVSTFLPCITYAQNKSRIHYLEANGARHPSGGEMINGDCFIHGCLTVIAGLGCILQIGNRKNIREHYRIEGGGAGDCFYSCCCQPCALTQEAREIELEEQSY